MDLKEKIAKIRESRFVDDKYHKYNHSVVLSGYILQKPREGEVSATGLPMRTFYVFQIKEHGFNLFPCHAFAMEVIKQLDKLEYCAELVILGRLAYNKKSRYSLQIEEIKIVAEFTELRLDPSYEPKGEEE